MLLYKWSFPKKLLQMQHIFNIHYSIISEGINFLARHIIYHFETLLTDNYQFFVSRFVLYRACIHHTHARLGNLIPFGLENVVGFPDGTQMPICKPGGNIQRAVYSGKIKLHSLKAQAINFPDGMIGICSRPVGGSQHDMRIFRENHTNENMRLHQLQQPWQGILYGDKAYTAWTHCRGLYAGTNLLPWQQESNNTMSVIRTGAEWPFAKLTRECKFLDFSQQLKLKESPIGDYFLIGVLITNSITCLYGGGTSMSFFNCPPPRLCDDYFNCSEIAPN